MPTELCLDIGNTRLKWGRCSESRVEEIASLADDTAEWETQAARWNLNEKCRWAVASVHPERRDRFADWVRGRGDDLLLLDSYRQLPMRVEVDVPSEVGIDRLLDALGSRSFRSESEPAVVVDAGTAVTVDAVAADGTFLGGYILPGLRLLADSLHRHTAKLPLVSDFSPGDSIPGKNTLEAIRGGVLNLLLGGIARLESTLTRTLFGDTRIRRILTGGDGPLLRSGLGPDWMLIPELTLEGIRLAARYAFPSPATP